MTVRKKTINLLRILKPENKLPFPLSFANNGQYKAQLGNFIVYIYL